MGLERGTGGSEPPVDPYFGAEVAPKWEGAHLQESVARAFPAVFTLLCLSIFLVPVYTVFHMGRDENVRFWVGKHLDVVLVLPVLYLAVHLVHHWRGGPVRVAIIACLIGSCLLLFCLGNSVLMVTNQLGSAFMASDCYALSGKNALQLEWEGARDHYANCVMQLSIQKNISFAYAINHYRMGDCGGYQAEAAATHSSSWPYLQFLEENYRCSGWCHESNAIWTFRSTRDACSTVVANILLDKVQWGMLQVVIYSIVVFAVVSVAVALGGPYLAKSGIAWQAHGGMCRPAQSGLLRSS